MIMNPVDVAKLILTHFSPDNAVIMLAIAYAESGLNSEAEGDSPSTLRNLGYSSSDLELYRRWNCPVSGRTTDDTAGCSIGLWQINIVPNHDVVMNLSGISFSTVNAGYKFPVPVDESNSCLLINWLKSPVNNVRAAKEIYDRQGFSAWSVYKYGQYKNYLTVSKNTVNQVLGEQTTPPPTTIPERPSIIGAFIYLSVVGAATAFIVYNYYNKKQ